MSADRRIVITGLGAVTPLGVGATPLIERWVDGECGIESGAGRAREFDPLDQLSRKEARRTDRFTQMAIRAAEEALGQAGFIDRDGSAGSDTLPHDPERIGCIVGTGIGGLGSLEDQETVLRERGAKAVSPLTVPLMMSNAASAAVAIRNGLHGETYGVVSACAAGAQAIGTAVRLIRSGAAVAVVAGGSEAAICSLSVAAFSSMGATSPTGISRPFDARRDGFVIGEGAGILILEDAEAAAGRGAEVLGEVLGYAATTDAYHLTAPEPSGAFASKAIRLALKDAGVAPDQLDYVNAHGTSTPLNDRSETEALKHALGGAVRGLPISSTKSVIGHTLGAAGAVEAVATIEALRRSIAPPTVGWEERDEELDLDYVPGRARALGGGERLVALSNSFGFGGHNAVLCLAATPDPDLTAAAAQVAG